MPDPTPDALDRMADFVLAQGLGAATLRPLARAAETSDRMLIYRFGSKDRLLARILDHLATRLTAILDAAPLPAASSPDQLAQGVLSLMQAPEARPYIALWLELVAGAARGTPGCQDAAARIALHFHAWARARIAADISSPDAAAARVLVLVEGGVVLGAAAGDEGRALANAALRLGGT